MASTKTSLRAISSKSPWNDLAPQATPFRFFPCLTYEGARHVLIGFLLAFSATTDSQASTKKKHFGSIFFPGTNGTSLTRAREWEEAPRSVNLASSRVLYLEGRT